MQLRDRLLGGLYGLLVGDAAGVPYEFRPPHRLPPFDVLELAPPPGYPRAHREVPVGTWSDDGAQALCLLHSLLAKGALDVAHFAATLQAWGDEGAFAVDNYVYGVGRQTAAALLRLRNGVPAHEAGGSEEGSNGNGALMRVLPLALWHDGPDELLVADAIAQARPTHGHPWSHVCVAWYCLVARQLLAGATLSEAWPEAALRLPTLLRETALEEAHARVANAMHDPPEGTGFVIDTLRSARWACDAPDFANVVRRAISLGHDTDTTACVAGGLAGIAFGLSGIPDNWLTGLRGRHIVDPLASVLLQHRCRV